MCRETCITHKERNLWTLGMRFDASVSESKVSRVGGSPMLEVEYICSDGPMMHVTESFLQNMDVK